MIILFVRHAEAKNDELTELGKRQAELLSEQAEDYLFSKIYTSPLNRCKITADYYNFNKNLEIEIDERIKEREILENPPKNSKEQAWYDNYLNPAFSFKNPEGCKELIERVYSFLDEKIQLHKQNDENFIMVSHSGIFYAVLSYFNKKQSGLIDWYKIGNCSKVYIEVKEK